MFWPKTKSAREPIKLEGTDAAPRQNPAPPAPPKANKIKGNFQT
jgi:hypothetical protein